MGRNKRGIVILFIASAIFLVLFILALAIRMGWLETDRDILTLGKSAGDVRDDMNSVVIDGQTFVRRADVDNYLLIGVDTVGEIAEAKGYNNSEKADFLLLLTVNRTDRTYAFIQINRDTMTEVPVLGIGGRKTADRLHGQIALAHTYGNGLSSSCINTVDAVSDLFFGASINNYLSMRMDVVAKMTDTLGGVPVTMPEDYIELDPEFFKGNIVTLSGEQALSFVRARGQMNEPTNTARMERQKCFMEAARQRSVEHPLDADAFEEFYLAVQDYIVNGFPEDALYDLYEEVRDYTYLGTVIPKGDADYSGEYVEFTADREDLKKIALTYLFVPKG